MQPVQLVIEFVPGQGVRIAGPIQDKMLCYGLLEMARDAIRDFKPPAVEAATPEQARRLVRH